MNITVATFCMGLTVKLRGLATAARLEPLAHAFFPASSDATSDHGPSNDY